MIALGLWLLGGLAAVVLAAVAGRLDRRTALLTVAGFAAAAAVAAAGWAVDPVWTGALLAGAAVAALLERLAVPLAALLSGVAAGSWLLIAATLALPVVVVALLALTAALLALALAGRRPGFVTAALRDEALLLVAALALAVSVTPPLLAGWQSGSNLHAGLTRAATPPDLAWPVSLLLLALLGGALISLWRRR